MELAERMEGIADLEGLPSGHQVRTAAKALREALALKGSPNFPKALFEAEANALAAYTEHTGNPFVGTEDAD